MARKSKSRRNRDRRDYAATLGGLLYFGALLLVAVAAVNSQRALLFVIFGLMLGAFVVSLWLSRRIVSAVAVVRDMPARTFANRVVHLGYYLRHRRRRGPAIGLELAEVRPPAELESVGAYCLYLAPGSGFKSGSRFVVRQRGRFELTGMRLSTRFPFSLLRARREIAQPGSLVVWPALGRLKAVPLLDGAAEISDAAPSQVRSGADEFFGLREYRQGDNPRWIHWKRSAATGALVVREMSKPRPDVLYVVMDSQLPDLSRQAVRLREKLIRFAATLIDHAFHREYRVGLAVASGGRTVAVQAAVGRGHRTALLDVLAEIDRNAEVDFSRVLAEMPRRLLRHAHAVVVAPDRRRLGSLEGLGRACRRLTVVTAENLDELFEDDRFEADPARVGGHTAQPAGGEGP